MFESGVDRNRLAEAIAASRAESLKTVVNLPQVDAPKPPAAAPQPPKAEQPKVDETPQGNDPLTRLNQLQEQEQKPGATEEEEEIPSDVPRNERAINTYKQLRSEVKRLEQEHTKAKAENEELRARIASMPNDLLKGNDEVKQLKERLAEMEGKTKSYEQELAKHDIRKTQNWRDNVDVPLKTNLGIILRFAETVGAEKRDILETLGMEESIERNKQLAHLFSDLDPLNFATLSEAVRYYDIAKQNEAYLESHAEQAKELLKQEASRVEMEKKEALQREFGDAIERQFKTLKSKAAVLSDATISQKVRDAASFIADDPSPDKMALGGMALEALIHIVADNNRLSAELDRINGVLQRREAATPGVRMGGNAPETPAAAPEPDRTPEDRTNRLAAALTAARQQQHQPAFGS